MSKLFFNRLLLGQVPEVRFKVPLFCKCWGPKHCDHPPMRERGHSKEEKKKIPQGTFRKQVQTNFQLSRTKGKVI